MNILFYGGCHAQVLHRIFSECFSEKIKAKLLINFKAIAELKSFPYDELKDIDVVIYSPIVSKESWNTIHLKNFCDENGIKTICYPWLEWHGYFPECSKGNFLGGQSWVYPKLDTLAKSIRSFNIFFAAVLDLQTETKDNLKKTTERLRVQEVSCDVDILVADFIIENYRSERLFLNPNHPSKALYEYVANAIAEKLNLTFPDMFFQELPEPQAGDEFPILPTVRKDLGLSFGETGFANKEILRTSKVFDFLEYAKLVFFSKKSYRFFLSNKPTFIKKDIAYSADIDGDKKRPVDASTLIMAEYVETCSDGHLVLASNRGLNSELLDPSYIFGGHWLELEV